MTLPETIPLLGFGWDDLLFMTFAAIMVGSALLVVTMRDIIRCGLAMIICFAALAGLYVFAGAPVVAAAQVLVYIGAISVLVLFAIMLTQTKAGPARAGVPDPGLPGRDRGRGAGAPDRGRRRRPPTGRAGSALIATDTDELAQTLFSGLHAAVRGRERAAPGGRDRRRVPRQARDGERRLMLSVLDGISQSLDAYLVLAGPPVRDRRRSASSPAATRSAC